MKELVLHVRIPINADDLDETAALYSDGEPTPEDRLNVVLEDWIHQQVGIIRELRKAWVERDKALALLDEIAAPLIGDHSPNLVDDEGGDIPIEHADCWECELPWPCAYERAVDLLEQHPEQDVLSATER